VTTELPIVMHERSVQGILDGRKTQTRRPVKPQPEPVPEDSVKRGVPDGYWWLYSKARTMIHVDQMGGWCSPYLPQGNILWVQENFKLPEKLDDNPPRDCEGTHVRYPANGAIKATGDSSTPADEWMPFGKLRPSVHMPRWACRLFLRVTDVRVERVQDISIEDAKAEGVETDILDAVANHYRGAFQQNWNETYDEDGLRWRDNPWVWVIEFERTDPRGRETRDPGPRRPRPTGRHAMTGTLGMGHFGECHRLVAVEEDEDGTPRVEEHVNQDGNRCGMSRSRINLGQAGDSS
jgi:hypothetical protein